MRFILILAMALLSATFAEAKIKKAAAKREARQMTEVELLDTAKSELRSLPAAKREIVPLQAPELEASTISTSEVLREGEKEPLAPSELEFGAQSFRPTGTGRISAEETYSFAGLSAKPMVLLAGRHWFYQSLRTSTPIRAGLGLQGGVSSHTLRIQTTRNYVYDNVRLNSFLAMIGPEAEYFLDGRRRFALGLRVAAGRSLLSQSAPNSSITQSHSIGAWEAGGHLRFQPTRNFYLGMAYARRATLGASQGLGIQENNYQALIGIGM